uniref:Ubiquitin-like domain-containing protein n=1 Tax=Romanomermis culicivorax TaxID=13658 RepID=A0A915L9K4_ROMCU
MHCSAYSTATIDDRDLFAIRHNPSSSLTYTTTTGEPVSLFVTGAANQIAIPNMNVDPQQQIQIQIQQQQQQSNRNQRQVVSTDNNNHKSHNVPGTSNQQQQQQQNSAFMKETIEYLDCTAQNLKLYANLNVNNDGKKLELLKTIHARSMELFNLTMWINEEERSKSQFFDFIWKEVIPNAVQQQQLPPVQSSSDQSDDEKFVKVTVVSPQNAGQVDEVRFRIRSTTELGKLKKAYADRLGLSIYRLRFVYRNRVIKDEETPQMAERFMLLAIRSVEKGEYK